MLDRIRSASILSISVLHGSSIGGGLLLGLAADYRAATRNAVFRLGVAPHGLSPVVMATKVLPMLLGSRLSTRMYADDTTLGTEFAVRSGVVSQSLPDRQNAREYGLCSLAGAILASIQYDAPHFIQETLFNAESSDAVSESLLYVLLPACSIRQPKLRSV